MEQLPSARFTMVCCATMTGPKLQRRAFLALGASSLMVRRSLFAATDTGALDSFIARYMKAMNADPGAGAARGNQPHRHVRLLKPRIEGTGDA